MALIVPVVLAAPSYALAVSSYPTLPIVGDALSYTYTAQRLASTGALAFGGADVREPNAVVTPGYVLFLAALYKLGMGASGTPDAWARAVHPWVLGGQFVLTLGLVALIAECGRALGGTRLGLISGVLAAVYLPIGWASSVALTDVFGAFLLTAQLLVALRIAADADRGPTAMSFAVLGALAAATALVRPAFALWSVVPFVYLAAKRASSATLSMRHVGVFAAVFALIMAPWWIRNYVQFERVILLRTSAGTPLLDSLGGRPLSAAEEAVASQAIAAGEDGDQAAALYRLRARWAASPSSVLLERGQRVWRMVAVPMNAPLDAFYTAIESERRGLAEWILLSPPPRSYSAVLLASATLMLWYQPLPVAAGVASVLYARRSPRLLLVLSVPAYAVIVHALALPLNRYFLPAMPALLVCAAAFGYGTFMYARRSRRGPAALQS